MDSVKGCSKYNLSEIKYWLSYWCIDVFVIATFKMELEQFGDWKSTWKQCNTFHNSDLDRWIITNLIFL